jgi:ethanolamine-phosphate cytidylyltransferase
VVGVHDDLEVENVKGAKPLQTNEERMRMIGACKWVDQVVLSKKYSPDYLTLLQEYDCDFAMHGSDVNLNAEGKDPFASVKAAGCLRVIEREGSLSSTQIIERLLRITSKDPMVQKKSQDERDAESYLLTTHQLSQFMNTSRQRPHVPLHGQTVVYIAGSFDIPHAGHSYLLRIAKSLGDYLIVGVHEDSTVEAHTGRPCVMNLFERTMNVLATMDVDEVVFDAPFIMTDDMLQKLAVNIVVEFKGLPGGDSSIDYPRDSTDTLQGLRKAEQVTSTIDRIGSKLTHLLSAAPPTQTTHTGAS